MAFNDIVFRNELPIIFQHFTCWNKDKIETNQHIKLHYVQWLEYQLYLYYTNNEESDILRWYNRKDEKLSYSQCYADNGLKH
jgi:hypothetical protein